APAPGAVRPPTELPPIPTAPALPAGAAPGAPGGRPVARKAETKPAAPQDPKGPQEPKDNTRQPIDRLLQPGATVAPGVTEAGAPESPYVFFPTLGFAGKSGVLPR